MENFDNPMEIFDSSREKCDNPMKMLIRLNQGINTHENKDYQRNRNSSTTPKKIHISSKKVIFRQTHKFWKNIFEDSNEFLQCS